MNILFLSHFDNYYGSSRSLMSLLDGLRKYQVNSFIVVPKTSSFTNELSLKRIEYGISPLPWWISKKKFTLKEKLHLTKKIIQSVNNIRTFINNWDINVVYTNSSVTPVGRMAAYSEGIPHIWHFREFGDLDFSLEYIYPKTLSLLFYQSSDALIFNSIAVKAHRVNPNTRRTYIVYNGSATDQQFDDRLKLRYAVLRNGNYVFAMVSSITPQKGQEAAIRAIAELKSQGVSATLLIAGNGEITYEDNLRNVVRELNIEDSVSFLGFVNDPYEIYYSCDCVLICSNNEALSRVGIEAMSTALPLIGRNSGGTPEIIQNEKTGLLYYTFEELVTCMNRMIQNPEWGKQLGINGWNLAKSKFCIENYARNVYQVIESVTNG